MVSARELVEAQLYPSEQDAVDDAVRHLLRARPDLRLQVAVHRYRSESISIGKAAELAGVSWAEMRDSLIARGILPRLGPESVDDARREVDALVSPASSSADARE